MSNRTANVQLTFDDVRVPSGHGGWRPNAGRPRGRSSVAHQIREDFPSRIPQHVTLRVVADLPSLRCESLAGTVRDAIAASHRDDFRIVEYNLEANHLHLITEANGKESLSSGLQASKVRIARACNRALQRSGSLFEDRYHSRLLRTPREVRNALRYVLLNFRHHLVPDPDDELVRAWVDPFSSAPWFTGWASEVEVWTDAMAALVAQPSPTHPARSWLLNVGWKHWGLLRFDEEVGTKR